MVESIRHAAGFNTLHFAARFVIDLPVKLLRCYASPPAVTHTIRLVAGLVVAAAFAIAIKPTLANTDATTRAATDATADATTTPIAANASNSANQEPASRPVSSTQHDPSLPNPWQPISIDWENREYQTPTLENLENQTPTFCMSANTPHRAIRLDRATGNTSWLATGELPEGSENPVYVNVPTGDLLLPPGPNRRIADDIRAAIINGCGMTGFEIKVGRSHARCSLTQTACETNDDCEPIGGQTCEPWPDAGFTVDFGLYTACPQTGGTLIPGTDGTVSFSENGLYTLVVEFNDEPVMIPNNFWLGVRFDRAGAGWVVGTPATTGFTANVYDFPIPAFACIATFNNTPLYAGFHARVFCGDDPPFEREFLAYSNAELDGTLFGHPSNAADRWMADDVTMITDECALSSYSIGVSGEVPFNVTTELWQECDPTTVIEGTQATAAALGNGSRELIRFDFPEGIEIDGSRVYVAVKFTTNSSSVLVAGEAELGDTLPTFGIFDWPPQANGCNWALGKTVGFSIDVTCRGEPPLGACCNLAQPPGGGEAPSCRELAEHACIGQSTRFSPGAKCPNTCSVNSAACESDADCSPVCSESLAPCVSDGDCPATQPCLEQHCVALGESFEPACGTSACCTPPEYELGEGCFALDRETCEAITGANGLHAIWNEGTFCDSAGFDCPIWACGFATGDCAVSHDSGACDKQFCCNLVCSFDPWCCNVAWDATCVQWTQEFCAVTPGNDHCILATELETNSVTTITNIYASTVAQEPPFCCGAFDFNIEPADSVWFTFVASDTSIRVHTCGTQSDGVDSVVGVYLAELDDSPHAVCQSLVSLGCSNDEPGCAGGTGGDVCVGGLVVGEQYHIKLASAAFNRSGIHELTLESPCPAAGPPPTCPVSALDWIEPPQNTVDGRQPHPPDDPAAHEGIDVVIVNGQTGTESPCCWSVCHSTAPVILESVDRNAENEIALSLSEAVTADSVLVVSYVDHDGEHRVSRVVFHPGNIDGDEVAGAQDIVAMTAILSTNGSPYQCDIDRNGQCEPDDLLRLLDVLNGGEMYEAWFGTQNPDDGAVCE